MVYYDRYEYFRKNGEVKVLPGISLEGLPSDKTIIYKKGVTRLDILSQKYYNNPYHGFLIMARNLEWGGLEFNIPDGVRIAIPFPFKVALENYNNAILKHFELYGEE